MPGSALAPRSDQPGARPAERPRRRAAAVLVAALGLLIAACGGSSPAGGEPASLRVPLGDSPARGPSDAWVTVVAFSDFQCPFCARALPTLEQLLADYPADVRVVFKHFPLSFHAWARPAAIAAECAREQGAFWEMHDRIFAAQAALGAASAQGGAALAASLEALARTAVADPAAWQACLGTATPASRVDGDRSLGSTLGVRGTPTFAVNGQAVVGAVPYEQMRGVVEAALARARASGVPRAEYYEKVVLGL